MIEMKIKCKAIAIKTMNKMYIGINDKLIDQTPYIIEQI